MNNPYTYALISFSALAHNLNVIKHKIPATTGIMAIVKSDAYGHGLVPISKELERMGVNAFGVAFVQEGLVLREHGITSPIYVLSGFQRGEEETIINNDLIPLVYNTKQIEWLDTAARGKRSAVNIHIKIDTGMGRLGVLYDDKNSILKMLNHAEHLNIHGLATHISDAHDSASFTGLQINRFKQVKAFIESKLSKKLVAHVANTDTFLNYPESVFDMIRVGISLYGYGHKDLKPVMNVFSRLISVKTLKKGSYISYGRTYRLKKDTKVGVIPVGYADGYFRTLSNKGFVGIKGKRVYIIGRVTMNHTMLDVDRSNAQVGDKVLIIGQDKKMCIGADHIARLASTISYELLCSMGSNIKRIYE
ncbi:MAG: alanine racemase [bacterium]